jgi:hypothetical protein
LSCSKESIFWVSAKAKKNPHRGWRCGFLNFSEFRSVTRIAGQQDQQNQYAQQQAHQQQTTQGQTTQQQTTTQQLASEELASEELASEELANAAADNRGIPQLSSLNRQFVQCQHDSSGHNFLVGGLFALIALQRGWQSLATTKVLRLL